MAEQPSTVFAAGSALPFKTQDAILANCLRAASFRETSRSPVVVYDKDILFKAGGGIRDHRIGVTRKSRYAGMNIVEATKRAFKEGQRGRVEYHFEHHADLARFCQIYSDQCLEIEAEGTKADACGKLLELASTVADDPRETILRILCIALKLRIEFVNRWKSQVPSILVRETGDTKSYGEGKNRIDVYPGGKMVSVNTDESILKSMGII